MSYDSKPHANSIHRYQLTNMSLKHAGRPAAPRGSGHHLARLAAPQAALRAQGDAGGGLCAAAPERALGARGRAARGRGGGRQGCGVPAGALRRCTGCRRRAHIPCKGMHPSGACRFFWIHTDPTGAPLFAHKRHGCLWLPSAWRLSCKLSGCSICVVWHQKQQQAHANNLPFCSCGAATCRHV